MPQMFGNLIQVTDRALGMSGQELAWAHGRPAAAGDPSGQGAGGLIRLPRDSAGLPVAAVSASR
jgi:hypothetical protein